MFVLLVSACGPKTIEGTYENTSIGRSFTFQSNGRVVASSNGVQIDEGPYTVTGDKIQVFNGPIFTLLNDGSIDGGMGYGRLTKK